MKIIILTTSSLGTAAHHIPYLFGLKNVEIAAVVISTGSVVNKKSFLKKRLKKIIKIGFLGAYNGIRMRKWYNEDADKYLKINNVEDFCREHNIPVRKVPYTNSEETRQAFIDANADVGLSLGNGYISKKIFSIPRYGMLNIHHEILPQYQNAQSIIWQIYNGSPETGYTIHKIDKNIDTGEIVLQEKIPITFRQTLADTVSYTSVQLLAASARGLVKVLENFDFYYSNAKPQGKGKSYTTPSYSQYLKIVREFKKMARNATNS